MNGSEALDLMASFLGYRPSADELPGVNNLVGDERDLFMFMIERTTFLADNPWFWPALRDLQPVEREPLSAVFSRSAALQSQIAMRLRTEIAASYGPAQAMSAQRLTSEEWRISLLSRACARLSDSQ